MRCEDGIDDRLFRYIALEKRVRSDPGVVGKMPGQMLAVPVARA
jgi:hypothetical protein